MNFFCSATIIVLLCVFHIAQTATHYRIDGNNYYVSTPDKANWYQAMRFCLYNGMHLIDVRTHFENVRILSIIEMNKSLNNLSYADYWTSGTDLGSEKNFYWATTGHSILWEYWAYDEPSHNGENCVHYYNGKASKWNDIKCDAEMFFICRDSIDIPIHKDKECAFMS